MTYFPRESSLSIRPRFLRLLLSLGAAIFIALFVFVLLGFVVPSLILEAIYGPWEDLPLGAGLVVAVVCIPVGLACLIVLCSLTSAVYARLSPSTERRTVAAGRLGPLIINKRGKLSDQVPHATTVALVGNAPRPVAPRLP
jgi:hypothetical protein